MFRDSARIYARPMTERRAMTADPAAVSSALEQLHVLLGDRLSQGEADRDHHGRDLSHHEAALPDAVAFARSTEEVAAIVRICAALQGAGHRLWHRHLA